MSEAGFVAGVSLLDEPGRPGMVWIPGGAFAMGSDKHYPEEGTGSPCRRRRLLDRPHYYGDSALNSPS